jgi:hypothetical protein
MRILSLLLLTAALLPACPKPTDDSGPDGDADTDTDADSDTDADGDVDMDEALYPGWVIGRIHVRERSWGGHSAYAQVSVELWDGLQPAQQSVVDELGDCALLDGPRIYGWGCEPPCADDEMCVEDHCEAYPGLAPSGTVTVTGLSAGEAVFEPGSDGRYPSSYDWPADIFEAEAPITVSSTGGATPSLSLSAWGVEPLVAQVETIVPGQDMHISWEPPGEGRHSRIQVMLETGWHGSTSMTTIYCDTADDGELTIPASLTAQFDIPSCGECEGSSISRYTHDAVDFGAGPVQLFVASELEFVAWW